MWWPDLDTESEAATVLAMRVARAFDDACVAAGRGAVWSAGENAAESLLRAVCRRARIIAFIGLHAPGLATKAVRWMAQVCSRGCCYSGDTC